MDVTYSQDMRHHPLSHGSRQPVVFYCFGRLRQLLGTFPLLVKRITLWMQNSTGFARIDAIRETFLAPHWLSLSRDNNPIPFKSCSSLGSTTTLEVVPFQGILKSTTGYVISVSCLLFLSAYIPRKFLNSLLLNIFLIGECIFQYLSI